VNFRPRILSSVKSFDPTVRVLRDTAMDAQRSRLPQMAAALSYRTIFGLIPVLAIGLWILHGMVAKDKIASFIDKVAGLVGLKGINVDPKLVGPSPPESTSLDPWINDVLAQVDKISFEAIGMVGLVMLLYAGIAMVVEIERAFNQIYGVPIGRSWTRRLVIYWALLTLGPIFLFASFYLQQQLPSIAAKWTYTGSEFLTSVLLTLGQATQYLISVALLLIVYQVVPNTKVKFWPALWGSLVAAMVFEAGKFGFARYVAFSASANYARLYGSLALIPLFLFWVYLTWIIVLFGLQLTFQLQHGRAKTRAQPIMDLGPTIVEPTGALTVMTALARAFADGQTLDAPAISAQNRIADPIVRLILSRLCERTLVHRLESSPARTEVTEPSFTLARAPSTIRIADLLDLGHELASRDHNGDSTTIPDPLIDRFHRAQIAAAGDDTLADVVPTKSPLPEGGDQREGESLQQKSLHHT